MFPRNAGIVILCAALAPHFVSDAVAQAYPNKPIRIIVGPGPDVMARLFGQRLTDAWGQQVVVDQRPGAGGNVAAEIVSKANADGYTLLVATSAFAANAVLQPAAFDLIRDFSPVVMFATSPLILVVHPSVQAKSVQDLVALARAKPGQINYASSGTGTAPHLAGEMFKAAAKVNIVHVAYKGAAPAIIDVMAGQVQMMIQIVPGVLGAMQSGKVRALAVTSARRTPLAPELPTLAESGFPGFQAMGWNGVLSPLGTPKATIARLNTEIVHGLAQAEVISRVTGTGWEPVAAEGNTPERFAEFIKSEISKFARLVKENGIKPD